MSIQTLLIAAQYLDYKAETEARGEEPQDYNSFLNEGNGLDCLSVSGSEQEYTFESGDYSESKFNPNRTNTKGNVVLHEKSISREVHNRLEKNRRAQMKEGFETLKQLTPNIGSTKVSNLKLLREVTKYIKDLNEECNAKSSEKKHLSIQNDALLSRKDFLVKQFPNLKVEPLPPDEDSNKVLEDGKSLLHFSQIVTMAAAATSNGPTNQNSCNANDCNSFLACNNSPVLSEMVASYKSDAELHDPAVLSASEKLMALSGARRNIDVKTKDPTPFTNKTVKIKRKLPETKELDQKLMKVQFDERVKLRKSVNSHSEECHNIDVPKKPMLSSNVQNFEKKCPDEGANIITEVIACRDPSLEQFNSSVIRRKTPDNNVFLPVEPNKTTESLVIMSPLTVCNKFELPAARNECDSILQKVLQSDGVKYNETSQSGTSYGPTTASYDPSMSFFPQQPITYSQNYSIVAPSFIEGAESNIKGVKLPVTEQLTAKYTHCENGTVLPKVIKHGQAGSVICGSNGSAVKLTCEIVKPDASKTFQNFKLNTTFPENGTQPINQNRVILDGDTKLYFVALQNPNQRIYINGSKA